MASVSVPPPGDLMAGASTTEQAAFAQQKLEDLYERTYQGLWPYREALLRAQEVLVWRRPVAASLLYLGVHWLFASYVGCEDSTITLVGNLLFWALLADMLWRMATSDQGQGREGGGGEGRGGRLIAKTQGPGSSVRMVPFDTIVVQVHSPRGAQQLVPFEVLCLHVAEVRVWLTDLRLALQYWCVHEPIVFTVVLAIPGLFLTVLGTYIPTVVIAYVIVMGTVVWPYVEYHGLRKTITERAYTHFPGVLQQVRVAWEAVKEFAMYQDDGDNPEFSLATDGDEAATQQALDEAFNQATTPPSPPRAEPGMSLLQDSVLGMHQNAFKDLEMDSLSTSSIALGPEEFPSISNLDHSLTLPAFPPNVHRPMPPSHALPPIAEEGEGKVVGELTQEEELDPFMDSLDLEFGFNFTDNKTTRTSTRPVYRRPQHHVSALQQPIPGFRNSALHPGRTRPLITPSIARVQYSSDLHRNDEISGRLTPPPSYDEAVSEGSALPYQYSPNCGGGGYAVGTPSPTIDAPGGVPRSSSTPVVGTDHQGDEGRREPVSHGLRQRTSGWDSFSSQ